jgi:DNA-binding MarR family transcriptional regulator
MTKIKAFERGPSGASERSINEEVASAADPGGAGLGTLLRHLTDLLDRGSEAHYRTKDIITRARYTPILRALGDGPLTVTELQSCAGVTQGAISQVVNLMEADGLVTRKLGTDRRSRFIELTARGRRLREQLGVHWRARFAAIEALEAEIGMPLRAVLAQTIEALQREGFATRIERAFETFPKAKDEHHV